MKITPTTLTITQLLSNNAEQFVIPPYQRRYSWRTKQITEFFDDIYLLEMSDTHLLGSMVCLTSSHKPGVNELELVDGQQRLTTIILFLNAIKNRLNEIDREKEAEKLDNYMICTHYDGQLQPKLTLGDLDTADFKLLLRNSDMDGVSNLYLREAYLTVKKLVSSLSGEKFESFRYKFVNQTIIIRLDVSEAKDAFKLFETINNRGLSLSPTDIIKNFLLGNASLIDESTLEDVKRSWTKIIVSLDDDSLDDFFRHYMMGVEGQKISFTYLTDYFKKYYQDSVTSSPQPPVTETLELVSTMPVDDTSDNQVVTPTNPRSKRVIYHMSINQFVTKLQKAAVVYSKILNRSFASSKINRHLDNLRKIRSQAAYTFLLQLLQKSSDEQTLIEVLEILETFMLRRNIAQYRTSELDDIFSDLALAKVPDIVNTLKITLTPHLPSDTEFEEKIKQHEFKGMAEQRAKYMLEKIEYVKTKSVGEKQIGDGSEVHLEHIMPQTINTKKAKAELGDWEVYLGDDVSEHKMMVSKLGNLTLLAAPLNISASNNPFAAKKEVYKQSEFVITQELGKLSKFGVRQINQRSDEFAKQAVEVWRF